MWHEMAHYLKSEEGKVQRLGKVFVFLLPLALLWGLVLSAHYGISFYATPL